MRKLRCLLGSHQWVEQKIPNRDPGITVTHNSCGRESCNWETTTRTISQGWCRENICDDIRCGSDSEHRVHTKWQKKQIKWQKYQRELALNVKV